MNLLTKTTIVLLSITALWSTPTTSSHFYLLGKMSSTNVGKSDNYQHSFFSFGGGIGYSNSDFDMNYNYVTKGASSETKHQFKFHSYDEANENYTSVYSTGMDAIHLSKNLISGEQYTLRGLFEYTRVRSTKSIKMDKNNISLTTSVWSAFSQLDNHDFMKIEYDIALAGLSIRKYFEASRAPDEKVPGHWELGLLMPVSYKQKVNILKPYTQEQYEALGVLDEEEFKHTGKVFYDMYTATYSDLGSLYMHTELTKTGHQIEFGFKMPFSL